jgi:alkylation response protein AidB-like acyl-CoA dehydrogenase
MQLAYTEDERRFRDELRAWLPGALAQMPPVRPEHDLVARRAYDVGWQRLMFEAGYAGIHWPREHGGRDATPSEHLVFLEELSAAGAPQEGANYVGLLHAGPTLIAEGSPAQQAEHLPAILRGDEVWCQGFSEPGAGSDLASLATRAVREGDEYIVTGQKIWTSHAVEADFCELLVRTDTEAPKHKGITWLILPMRSPGVEVRPLRTIEGTDEFAELFLDEVRIPVDNRVGAENDGWRVAMVTFSFERGTSFVSQLLESMRDVRDLVAACHALPARGATVWDDPGVRREAGAIAAEFDGLWALTQRNVTRATRGVVTPAGASSFKLQYAEACHRLGDLSLRVLGNAGLVVDEIESLANGRLVRSAMHAFGVSIAAGTSQIQRNIIAERVLGLPKEA